MPLTKWHNDPVTDHCPITIKIHQGEALLYEFGSSPQNASWQTIHSRGYSTYATNIGDLKILVTVVIDINSGSMIISTDIQNAGSTPADIVTDI